MIRQLPTFALLLCAAIGIPACRTTSIVGETAASMGAPARRSLVVELSMLGVPRIEMRTAVDLDAPFRLDHTDSERVVQEEDGGLRKGLAVVLSGIVRSPKAGEYPLRLEVRYGKPGTPTEGGVIQTTMTLGQRKIFFDVGGRLLQIVDVRFGETPASGAEPRRGAGI